MNLAIDIGNTLVKLAVFDKGQMTGLQSMEEISISVVQRLIATYPGIEASIIASVRNYPNEIEGYLNKACRSIYFNPKTPVPLSSLYTTPETLGADRIAAAVSAHKLFPSDNILLISTGTAITYDIVTGDGIHMGGAISPGLQIRFKALHTFTGRLPLLDEIKDIALTGTSTNDSILSGVLNGTLAEVDGMIERYGLLYTGLKTILTGGDNNYFDKRLKNKTFAIPNLVLTGLNIILEYNLEKSP